MLKEIDELYLNNPYYLVPDGEVGQPARESGLHVS
jgi:non-homologous end joining protein Ku